MVCDTMSSAHASALGSLGGGTQAGGVPNRRIVLVSGLSGAGHSTALKVFEDRGFEAVDNLRLSLVAALVQQSEASARPLAIGIDSRTRDFSAEAFGRQLDALQANTAYDVRLLFLNCSDEVLQRRYTETRRLHPMAIDRPVSDGIARERVLLSPLRERADYTVDTTDLSVHDLRRILNGHFELDAEPSLQVFVVSFSYRKGVPRDADLMVDVRFLTNPHWDMALRPLSGLDAGVAAAIERDVDFPQFFDNLIALLEPLLPRYRQEGKSYLTIAIGCSGGRHRSVFVAERLAHRLRGLGLKVGLNHRDLERTPACQS